MTGISHRGFQSREGAAGGSNPFLLDVVASSSSSSPRTAPSLTCGCSVDGGIFCLKGMSLLTDMVARSELVVAGLPRFILRGAIRRLLDHLKVDRTLSPLADMASSQAGVRSRSFRRIP